MRVISILAAAFSTTLTLLYPTTTDASTEQDTGVRLPTMDDMKIMSERRVSNIQDIAVASTKALNEW
jgi:hypothetical protein